MVNCESFQETDVVIIGAGLAGRWFSNIFTRNGIPNIVIGRKPPEKSLLVQGAVLEKHGLFEPVYHGGNALNRIDTLFMDYPDQSLVLEASSYSNPDKPNTAFYAVSHHPLLEAATQPNSTNIWDTFVMKVTVDGWKLVIDTPQQRLRASYLIDATGPRSTLSRNLIFNASGEQLPIITDDPLALWCFGERVVGQAKDSHTLYRPVSRGIGSGSWILPWENGEIDLVAAGFSRLSRVGNVPKRLIFERFKQYCLDQGYIDGLLAGSERISGLIRLQPMLAEASAIPNVFLAGDAAGFGSPAYGEVIPAILDYAEPLANFLKKGGSARDYYEYWRYNSSIFPYSLEQAFLKLKAEPFGRVDVEDNSTCQGAGSNAALYRFILESLPPKVQRRFLKTRKIPVISFIRQFKNVIDRPDFLKYLASFGRHYFNVKLAEMRSQMP